MKHNPMATANALASVGGILYLVCAGWVLLFRPSFMGMMNSWAHGLNLGALPPKTPDLGTIVVGFLSFTVVAWLTGYAFAMFYNYFLSKK